MRDKQQPIGICDHCLQPMPRKMWYTRRGPRLYCGVDCKNTANSRNSKAIRAAKARERVARGEWQNPHFLNPPTPEEQARRSHLARKREVERGTWRNPALSAAARAKLSRPRKHNDLVHRALEKLRIGTMADLTDEERDAYREYRRQLRLRRRNDLNRQARERYHHRIDHLTTEERDALRAQWRRANQRRSAK